MPIFEYRGLTKDGRNTKGVVDSENLRAARARLKKDGIFVVDIKDKKKQDSNKLKSKTVATKTVSVKDISLMTRQLATLIKANIPLVDALGAISEQVDNPVLAESLADCKNMVNEGASLHKALAKYPNIYSNIFVSMVEAGEMSGTLDMILVRLAEFAEAQFALQERLKSAMTYPVIMIIAAIGLMGFLFVYVLPKMTTIFESNPDFVLPWYSSVIFDISGILVNYWYILLGAGFTLSFLFSNWKKSPQGRPQWDAISLRMPIFGEITRMVAVARFTRTLSTLLTGGVPMLAAMQIVRNVVDNAVIAKAVDDARSNISEGESIAGPLKKSGQFPPIVIHMVTIGEKTGELENMLTQVSDAYDFQVKNKIDGLTAMIGPVVLLIMGLAIGTIVFSVMVPMMEMTNNIQ